MARKEGDCSGRTVPRSLCRGLIRPAPRSGGCPRRFAAVSRLLGPDCREANRLSRRDPFRPDDPRVWRLVTRRRRRLRGATRPRRDLRRLVLAASITFRYGTPRRFRSRSHAPRGVVALMLVAALVW